MDLLRQTFESFNPNQMTTQINVPNDNIPAFTRCCDTMQIIYHQLEVREHNTRYEIEIFHPSILFYLGTSVGLECGFETATKPLQNGK